MNVYVIVSEGGFCKIGKANDPQKRVRELSTGSAFKLTVAYTFPLDSQNRCFDVERMAHDRLASKRMAGEWFNATADEAADAVRASIAAASYATDKPEAVSVFNTYQTRALCKVASDLLKAQTALLDLMSKGSSTADQIDAIGMVLSQAAIGIRDVYEGNSDDDDL